MFAKIMLVMIFMAGDGSGYSDIVSLFHSAKQCEEARAAMLSTMRSQAPKDARVFSVCTKTLALHSAKV